MKKSIDMLTEELKGAILESDQYKRYLYYKELLDREPQLRDLVNDIRRKSFLINNTAEMSGEDIFNETQKFKDDYARAKSNQIAYDFFDAELTMCRIIQDINYKIIRDLDFNINFLEN